MAEPARRLLDYEEYLEIERSTGEKHEFLQGHVLAMAGASPEHGELCANLISLFKTALRGRPCKVYPSDLKVRVSEDGLYTYPDVSVVCGALQRSARDANAVCNPVVLCEVLSDTTEGYDRGEKFEQYQQIPSFLEYILVSQRGPSVDHLRRNPDGTWTFRTLGPADSLRLDSVGVTLPVAEIYEGVTLPMGPRRADLTRSRNG